MLGLKLNPPSLKINDQPFKPNGVTVFSPQPQAHKCTATRHSRQTYSIPSSKLFGILSTDFIANSSILLIFFILAFL